MSDINQQRASAVRGAWKNESTLVRQGQGTRNWSQRQQIGIIRKGQVNGYDGHHMQSVKTHQKQAGNPKNIQFLSKKEHIKGAHRGNTKNATNGYYNPNTGTMYNFGKNRPQAPQMKLSQPLSQKQINSAVKREQTYQNRVTRDTSFMKQWRQTHVPMNNKGIAGIRQKVAQKQSLAPQSGRSANQVIKGYQSKASGQSTRSARGSASTATKGASSNSGRPGGSSRGGQSSGSSQGR